MLGEVRRNAIREQIDLIDKTISLESVNKLVQAWDVSILKCRQIQLLYDYDWIFMADGIEKCFPPGATQYEWVMYVTAQCDETFLWELVTLHPFRGPQFMSSEPTIQKAKLRAQAIYEIYARDEHLKEGA